MGIANQADKNGQIYYFNTQFREAHVQMFDHFKTKRIDKRFYSEWHSKFSLIFINYSKIVPCFYLFVYV